MNSNKLLQKATKILKKNSKSTPELDCKILLGYVLGLEDKIYFHDDFDVSIGEIIKFEELIQLRIKGMPVSKILGKRNFWENDFFVNEFTLDPRPESELLIEIVLNYFQDKNKDLQILDLGSGSGCIGISLLKEFPFSYLFCLDICRKALNQVKRNSKNLQVFDRLETIQTNWFNAKWTDAVIKKILNSQKLFKTKFDVIVCNPPYIRSNDISELDKEVKKYDPLIALDGGLDGCDSYRAIFSKIRRIMNKECIIALEVSVETLENVKNIVERSGFKIKNIYKDISGNCRALLIK